MGAINYMLGVVLFGWGLILYFGGLEFLWGEVGFFVYFVFSTYCLVFLQNPDAFF